MAELAEHVEAMGADGGPDRASLRRPEMLDGMWRLPRGPAGQWPTYLECARDKWMVYRASGPDLAEVRGVVRTSREGLVALGALLGQIAALLDAEQRCVVPAAATAVAS